MTPGPSNLTSAEIVVEFIQGRPNLLAEMKKEMNDPFRAPELYADIAKILTMEALSEVSEEERTKLDRMRGNGPVNWQAVADAFRDEN